MNPAYAGYQNPRRDMGFEDYLSSSSSFASSPLRHLQRPLQRPLLSVVSNVLSSTSSPSATSGRLCSLSLLLSHLSSLISHLSSLFFSHLFSLLIFLF
ncbi:unnamed protein product [Prunus armeniaca]